MELVDVLKNFKGISPDMLYDDLIVLDGVDSSFDSSELDKFITLFVLHTNGRLTYDEYANAMTKMNKINPDTLKSLRTKLQKGFPDWFGISADEEKSKKNIMKIYLSVDNSSIHKFINYFIGYCLEYGLDDYDFKLNSNEGINRRDNVVIYCNENNIGKYLRLVESILSNRDLDIKFNESHLLGIPYTERISCGIDVEDGKESYTDKLCSDIFKKLKNGVKPERIADIINSFREKQVVAIMALADMDDDTKKKGIS